MRTISLLRTVSLSWHGDRGEPKRGCFDWGRACVLACGLVCLATPLSAQPSTQRLPRPVPPLARSADSVRVAVAQMKISPEFLRDGKDTVDALLPWIDQAAEAQADLIVFPEYLLGPFHLPDEKTDKLCDEAKRRDLSVIVGGWEYLQGTAIEQSPEPGTYANTVLVIDREGNVAGKHRKMHAAIGSQSPYCWPADPGERGENTMVLGEENGVIDLDFGRIGLLTCYDGYFFESFQMPSLRGAEILVWVNSRGGMVEPHLIQAASFVTCTHVVASNQSVGCGSAICSYPGWRLDKSAPEPGSEALLVSDLDLKELRQQRLNHRMHHQRRPQIYQPMVQAWQPWTAYPELVPFRHAPEGPTDAVE
ncbi:carbon-nitrogen hydrolase family protein [Roseiconus nitratireducens]|nr:carbon-nitrogen hydrolase family protein [Roseiconus nitratireducens]